MYSAQMKRTLMGSDSSTHKHKSESKATTLVIKIGLHTESKFSICSILWQKRCPVKSHGAQFFSSYIEELKVFQPHQLSKPKLHEVHNFSSMLSFSFWCIHHCHPFFVPCNLSFLGFSKSACKFREKCRRFSTCC